MTLAKPVLTLKKPRRSPRQPPRRVRRGTAAGPTKEPPRLLPVSDEDLLAALQVLAPELWNPEAPVPLAVGIHKQLYPLAERLRMSRRALRGFLGRWTSASAYQRAMAAPGAQRFNLDGTVAEPVSPQHAEIARRRLGTLAD